MRIAFVNHSRRKVGGAEVYLDSVVPAFAAAGHEIACLHEDDTDSPGHELIRFPESVHTWCAQRLGREETFNRLKKWRPDVCFVHGLHDPVLEEAVVALGCGALYVHSYYGMCISGQKMHDTDPPQVCEKRFGAACLARYFPQRCGGNHPLTMWQMYRVQSRRQQLMRRYRALIADSEYMSKEMARHGLKSETVYYPLIPREIRTETVPAEELHLVFAARMTSLKGGQYLLAALPEVQGRLERRLRVTFAGDGPDRSACEKAAGALRSDKISIEFRGWLGGAELDEVLRRAHLLVYPSIWPEPFGLSGLEAGLFGVPSVAFAVGGIPEWLHEGVNGHLAEVGAGPLAAAIVRSVKDPRHYAELRAGASRRAHEYSLDAHLSQLLKIFERCRR